MTTVTYTLEEFAHDMESLLRDQPDQAKIFDVGSAWLKRLIGNPHSIPEQYRLPAPNGRRSNHGSYLLYQGDSGLSVTAVVWGPGEHLGPHDHRTWGMIGVVGNAIQETRYRRVDDRTNEDTATLVKDRVSLVKPGQISLLLPDEDEIHAMDNFSDRHTVEIHVYGHDLVGLERAQYDLNTGRIKRFASGRFDNC